MAPLPMPPTKYYFSLFGIVICLIFACSPQPRPYTVEIALAEAQKTDSIALAEAKKLDSITTEKEAHLIDFRPLDSLNKARLRENKLLAARPCVPVEMSIEEFFLKLPNDTFVNNLVLKMTTSERKKALSQENTILKKGYKGQWHTFKKTYRYKHTPYHISLAIEPKMEYSCAVNLEIAKLSNHVFMVVTTDFDYEVGYYTESANFVFICWDSLSNKLVEYPRPPRFYIRDMVEMPHFKKFFPNPNPYTDTIWAIEISSNLCIKDVNADSVEIHIPMGRIHRVLHDSIDDLVDKVLNSYSWNMYSDINDVTGFIDFKIKR